MKQWWPPALLVGPDATAWFEVIGAGDVVPRKKPAPDIYTWVVERLGLRPEECLAVEDSAVGLRAAVAAGLPTVVTQNPYTASDDTTGALAVLGDLSTVTLADLSTLHDTVRPDTQVHTGPTYQRSRTWTSPAATPTSA